jgi:hypothetical protein
LSPIWLDSIFLLLKYFLMAMTPPAATVMDGSFKGVP